MSEKNCSCDNKKICNTDQKVSKSFSENWDNINWDDYKPNVKMKQKKENELIFIPIDPITKIKKAFEGEEK